MCIYASYNENCAEDMQTLQKTLHLVDNSLEITMYTVRSTISKVPTASLGSLAVPSDVLLNVPLILEWQIIAWNWEVFVINAMLKPN